MIINAAIELFRAVGLKFTMQDVAESLHIAKKTIYAEFESKEELLNAMLDSGFEKIHAGKKAVMESDLPLCEKIRRTMIAMPDQFLYLDFRRLSELDEKYPRVYLNLKKHLETGWEPVTALIEEGIRSHVIRPVSIPLIREIFTASIESFLHTDTLIREDIAYSDALDTLMDIIMNGIREDRTDEENQ